MNRFWLAAIALLLGSSPAAHAIWQTLVNGSSFDSAAAFNRQWSPNYPWGTDHNGSARMNATNISVNNGVVTLASSLTNAPEDDSSASPYLTIRYNSATFYLKQQVVISPTQPVWDVSGQFKVPVQRGTWPALWLTGADSWPPESDIMEFKGSDSCGQNTYVGRWITQSTTVSTAETAWHSYRVVAVLENTTHVDLHYYIDGIMESVQTAPTFVNSSCWVIIDYQMEGSSGEPGPSYTTYTYVSNIVIQNENVSSVGQGPTPNGAYRVTARGTGHCLGVLNQSTATNSLVGQCLYHAGLNEQWIFTYLGSGQFSIIGRQSGRALAVINSSAPVVLSDYTGGNGQKWTLVTTCGGYYELINVKSGKALVQTTFSQLGLERANGAANQQWALQAP